MPLYRPAAELRRVHRNARWVLTGLVIDGEWHPVDRRIEPATARLIEADLVDVAPLLPVLAPNPIAAVAIACGLAADQGWPSAREAPSRDVLRGPKAHRVSMR